MTGVSRYNLTTNPITVADALKEVAAIFPQIRELILDEVPEVSFILGDRILVTPKDLSLALNDELIIGPIVAGG